MTLHHAKLTQIVDTFGDSGTFEVDVEIDDLNVEQWTGQVVNGPPLPAWQPGPATVEIEGRTATAEIVPSEESLVATLVGHTAFTGPKAEPSH
jgi:hypothetical protein